jgi:methylmalonyl-CoA/ethylmalonyl-CoA epimerase
MFTDIHHAGYLVQDLDASIDMYEKVFGGSCIKRGSTPSGRNCFVQIGEILIELIEPADKTAIAGRGGQIIDHIGYVVPDILKAGAELKAKGYRFASEQPRMSIIGVQIWYLDTDDTQGTRIHLTQV